jgi:hypothetical protein
MRLSTTGKCRGNLAVQAYAGLNEIKKSGSRNEFKVTDADHRQEAGPGLLGVARSGLHSALTIPEIAPCGKIVQRRR